MAAIFLIIGGAAGGFLGWLLDKRNARNRATSNTLSDHCETRT
jgi:hypothetical protein